MQILKNILVDFKNDVSIEYNETNAKFIFENYTLSCRLIEGKYPNYEAVIPKENPNKLIIERILLLNLQQVFFQIKAQTKSNLKLLDQN